MENKKNNIDDFIKEYGFDAEELTDKEKLNIVNRIIFHHNVDKDWEDLRYSKIAEADKTQELANEYISKIECLDLQIGKAMSYKNILRVKLKKERKLRRKENVQKVLKIFNK